MGGERARSAHRRIEAITAAREQLASIDPTDAYRLARLLLAVLGEEP